MPSSSPSEPGVVVVGSLNMDLTLRVPTLPRPGETLLALSLERFPGGKGGNQAIAAARLGAPVAFLGAVGADDEGRALRDALTGEGIAVEALAERTDVPTGQAIVMVDDAAENSIVVVGGANATLSPADVERHRELVAHAPVLVAQLEVPLDTVSAAAKACRGTVILNPAPAQALPDDLLAAIDVLVVNETEFGAVLGGDAAADDATLISTLQRPGIPGCVVITRGGDGVVLLHQGSLTRIPTPSVRVVDTTGAGDTFVGALAAGIATGHAIPDAVARATVAASLSTQALGATSGMPTLTELDHHVDPTGKAPVGTQQCEGAHE